MAGLPTLQKIAQQHTSVYETYFRQVNPSGSGQIPAIEAANFLKKSGLPEGVLHNIWEQADAGSKGYLDKHGFYVALKLISLAQSNKECHIKNLALTTAPPNMGDSPRDKTLSLPSAAAGVNIYATWSISAKEKKQYDGIFDGLKPINGLLPGDKVKPVLLNSKLPVDTLGKIWGLSDIDQDGSLDRDEFCIAMFLVYRGLDHEPMPATLPPQLVPLSKKSASLAIGGLIPTSASSTATTFPPTSSAFPSISAPQPQQSNWVVQPADKVKYDQMFIQADTDKDGLVSGGEIKDILMASGLAQNYLAYIWNLCDINNTGQLDSGQFALAMYFIGLKKSGKDLPVTLTPEMIPPSSRTPEIIPPSSRTDDLASIQFEAKNNDFSAIKELDKITTEIEALGKEKSKLQQEITETEEAIRNRRSEIENLQNELEKANKGLDVLSSKKKESESSLEALDNEYDKYFELLQDVKSKCSDEKQHLQQMKTQLASQESTNKGQEQELAKARKELDDLKKEENDLENQVQKNKNHLESLKSKTAITKSEFMQVQSRIDTLNEENNAIKDEINQITSNDNALGDPNQFDARFKDMDQISARATAGSSPVSSISGFSVGSKIDDDDFKDSDPFKTKADPFSGTDHDPFNSDDPFKSDPFKSVSFNEDPFAGDPFQSSGSGNDPFKADPFKSSSTSSVKENEIVASGPDPFGNLDPFGSGAFASGGGSGGGSLTSKSDTSDPFGSHGNVFGTTIESKKQSTTSNPSDTFHTDPFGSADPFESSDTKSNDPFGSSNTKTDDLFASSNMKSDDPFGSSNTKSHDPFGSSNTKTDDPFGSSNTKSDDPFGSSSTKSDDPFASSSVVTSSSTAVADPFAPSNTSTNDPFSTTSAFSSAKDPFSSSAVSGDDPFSSTVSPRGADDPFSTSSGGGGDVFGSFGGDPFSSATSNKDDPFSTTNTPDSNDAWFAFSDTKPSKEKEKSPKAFGSEASQLEWAKKESERAEKDRKKRMKELADKEEMDIALALKQSVESSSDA